MEALAVVARAHQVRRVHYSAGEAGSPRARGVQLPLCERRVRITRERGHLCEMDVFVHTLLVCRSLPGQRGRTVCSTCRHQFGSQHLTSVCVCVGGGTSLAQPVKQGQITQICFSKLQPV